MTVGTQAITTVHFVWMAVLAVLVVIGIVVGMRAKRRRIEAREEVEAHAEEAGVADAVAPAAEAGPPPPIAPAPPPLADQPAPGTPPVASPPAQHPLSDEPPRERPLADEPIAAVAPDGTTAAVALDPAPTSDDPRDGAITQIKGLGPKVAARLGELGIDRVGQLAALDDAQAAELDAAMGPFTGRMARDRWIEQARLLAAGDREGFERVFGKL